MTGALFLLLILGIPAAAAAAVALRIQSKRQARDRFVESLGLRLAGIGAEGFAGGRFRRGGRTFRLAADINPLFSNQFDLRLSTFCDSVLEFEIRRARNVPVPLPEPLRSDALFRGCALDAPSPTEPARYLSSVRESLARSFPERWGAFSKMHCELVLSANRFAPGAWDDAGLRGDLETLAALAAVPAWREPKGGTWTFREGFEPRQAGWHWKPEQKARLPEGTRRWCVSCWSDNAYLNRPLIRFFRTLAGPASTLWLTPAEDLGFLEEGFGRRAQAQGHLAELDPPEMAVAADQYLDGEFFAGLLAAAPDRLDGIRKRFAAETRFRFHDAAIDLLPGLRFYARRLYDDEFSWFSGEYEIVSATLEEHEVRGALDSVAKEFGAVVKEIERPFSFKLLRDDRLDLSF
ncbi:MAG TPA: hypothetical protein VGK61_02965 [Planctomycetota bacterium]